MHSQKLYFFNWENWVNSHLIVVFNIDLPHNRDIPHSDVEKKSTRCNGE